MRILTFLWNARRRQKIKKGQQHLHIETLILKRGIFGVPVDGISRFFGRINKYSQTIKKIIFKHQKSEEENSPDCGKIRTQSGTESIWHAKIINWKVLNYFLLFDKFLVGKAFSWELWDQRGTKNRTMVRTFVPKCLLGISGLNLKSTSVPKILKFWIFKSNFKKKNI